MFSQKGQVLLIVILVVIISSTIGLSLASRSITNIRTSTEEAESQKALSAAEAGIERTLQGNVSIGNTNLSNKSNYFVDVTTVNGSTFLINGGNIIPKDEGADVWFVKHDANGNPDYSSVLSPKFLNLYWGTPSEKCGDSTAPAAIQAIVVTRKSATEIKTHRYAYDSCNRGNNFTKADSGSFPKDYDGDGKTDITFGNNTPKNDLARGVENIVFIRVIPIYKDAVIGVYACNHGGKKCTVLPSQGFDHTSTGTSGSANRKITVFEGYPQTYLPYLSYGLFVAN